MKYEICYDGMTIMFMAFGVMMTGTHKGKKKKKKAPYRRSKT